MGHSVYVTSRDLSEVASNLVYCDLVGHLPGTPNRRWQSLSNSSHEAENYFLNPSWFNNYLFNQAIQIFNVRFNPESFLHFSFH